METMKVLISLKANTLQELSKENELKGSYKGSSEQSLYMVYRKD